MLGCRALEVLDGEPLETFNGGSARHRRATVRRIFTWRAAPAACLNLLGRRLHSTRSFLAGGTHRFVAPASTRLAGVASARTNIF